MYDNLTEFDPTNNNLAQVIGSYLSAQSIDTGVPGTPAMGGPLVRDYGRTLPVGIASLQMLVNVTTSFASAGAATLRVQVVQADDAALTVNLEVIREGRPLDASTAGPTKLVAGSIINMGPIPTMARRFLGLQYAIAGATTTAGTVQAGLRTSIPGNSKSLLAGF